MGIMYRSEYPQPQFQRDEFTVLNGQWHFSVPDLKNVKGFESTIEVPFCPESKLSGIGYTDFISEGEYRRTFTVDYLREGERLVLNFGAVDYAAHVYVNGQKVGQHRGGFTPFGFDIAPYVTIGENEITVKVYDDVTDNLPSGKQSAKRNSYGCFYTRVTGIWQTVWLERTPADYVRTVKFFPDIHNCSVRAELDVEGERDAEITVFYNGRKVGSATGKAEGKTEFNIELSEKHLWEPGYGRLYDVEIRYGDDKVKSYFGLREVRFSGMKFMVNDSSVFQRFVLDQGYYPDGLYTAPSDQAFIDDITSAIKLGYNGVRLHQKVFEPRYLYHCDRMGFMAWGEFPSWGVKYDNLSALGDFVGEWVMAVERDFNHPCIITWCPLNETWCDLEDNRKLRDVRFVDSIYEVTKNVDPTRPCVDVSGGFHGHKTDLYDFHDYKDADALQTHLDALMQRDELIMDLLYAPKNNGDEASLRYASGLPSNISEYGGVAFGDNSGWGYHSIESEEEFVANYIKLTEKILKCPKLSGFCYTQLYDIEQEQNGLLTYDRKPKLSAASVMRIAACNLEKAAIEQADDSV